MNTTATRLLAAIAFAVGSYFILTTMDFISCIGIFSLFGSREILAYGQRKSNQVFSTTK